MWSSFNRDAGFFAARLRASSWNHQGPEGRITHLLVLTVLGAGVLIVSQLVNGSMLVDDVPGFNSVGECPDFDQLILRRLSLSNLWLVARLQAISKAPVSDVCVDRGVTYINRGS